MDKSRLCAVILGCGIAATALAGCNQSISALETRSPPQPLPSAPLEPVQSSELDPALPGSPQALTSDPNAFQEDTRIAAVEQDEFGDDSRAAGDPDALQPAPENRGPPLSREALAGTWNVSSDNPDCRIILAFTKWSGGYRAATRRCETAELTAVSAWDVREDSVILVDSAGQTIASLYANGPERYDGSTAGGARISFSR